MKGTIKMNEVCERKVCKETVKPVTTYNVTEYAKRIGRCRDYVYKLINKGLITPKTTINGERYFTEEDVKKYFGEK